MVKPFDKVWPAVLAKEIDSSKPYLFSNQFFAKPKTTGAGGVMYQNHYGLHSNPFQISTDPHFLWLGDSHKEGLASLQYALLENKGFLLLTGEVGTGKTTLVNALIASLGDRVHVAMVYNPGLECLDFYRYLFDALRLNCRCESKGDFLIYFKKFLFSAAKLGKQVLLIIDEAQRLTPETLEEIRLLSNIEKPEKKILNIFFVGQQEFNDHLLESRNDAVRQRITVKFELQTLSETETGEYVGHRLQVAGANRQIFTPAAIGSLHRFTMGHPRLINILCDRALLTGFATGQPTISPEIIAECIPDVEITGQHPALAKEHNSPAPGEKPAPIQPSPPIAPTNRRLGTATTIALFAVYFGLIATICGFTIYFFHAG